jgi:hypothetical protein
MYDARRLSCNRWVVNNKAKGGILGLILPVLKATVEPHYSPLV